MEGARASLSEIAPSDCTYEVMLQGRLVENIDFAFQLKLRCSDRSEQGHVSCAE
jgi:hypothetical protein